MISKRKLGRGHSKSERQRSRWSSDDARKARSVKRVAIKATNVKGLKALARQAGVIGYSSMRRAQLEALLLP